MASRPDSRVVVDKALLAVAAKVAREKCLLHKSEIAARAGMHPRMLHRLTSGTTRATESQLERILQACNLPATTSRLLAESDQADLIGTSAHDWLESFVRDVIANLALVRSESGMDVEGRWAAGDAALILTRWQKNIGQRRDFMAGYFAAECLGVRDRDT